MTNKTSNSTDRKAVEAAVSKGSREVSCLLRTRPFMVAVKLFDGRASYDSWCGRKTEPWEVASARSRTVYMIRPSVWPTESSHGLDELARIIKHEVVHLYIDQIADGRLLPRWLSEGLANVLAGGYRAGPCFIETDFTRKLDTGSGWERYANFDAYRTAFLFTKYLVDRYGISKLLRLIKSASVYYSYRSFSRAFAKAMGLELGAAEAEFLDSLDR